MALWHVISVAAVLSVVVQVSSQRTSLASNGGSQTAVVERITLTGNVDRGRYIVEQVAMCAECHSRRNQNGKIIATERFMGGPIPFKPPWPNDWVIRAPRIRDLPGYTEALGVRLLTQGSIDRSGRRLRPPMPRYRMTRQDAADVVAYLKSFSTTLVTEK